MPQLYGKNVLHVTGLSASGSTHMKTGQHLSAWGEMSRILRSVAKAGGPIKPTSLAGALAEELRSLVQRIHLENPWFTTPFVAHALEAIAAMLDPASIEAWLSPYRRRMESDRKKKIIGVIMAGNLPLVGFHDFLCVLLSGHAALCKQSSGDKLLLPAVARILTAIEPAYGPCISFVEKFPDFDAVIATGSNNTYRYFEYYFRSHPCLLRKSRHGVAVLDGAETKDDLESLADDIMLYFGLGCRSVSSVWVPQGYDFTAFLTSLNRYTWVSGHNKYRNNYDYYKAVYLVNGDAFYDNGFLMLRESMSLDSPVSVVHYRFYRDAGEVLHWMSSESESLQCLVSHMESLPGKVPFGAAQTPGPADYADGIDTLDFLLRL
jgi:hypothetical protein